MKAFIDFQPSIRCALEESRPVVALETSLVSHGFPWPENLETLNLLEKTIVEEGAVPAPIGVIDGRIKVGLSAEDKELMSRPDNGFVKTSRRDLSVLIANKQNGATTVASTMIIAGVAGIHVFATGGIGGVHRGATETFDISADLQELARTPVAVVCAGPKIILDLKLTLEYLETMGVPVLGYCTDDLPAFYCQTSGLPVDHRCNSAAGIARIIKTHQELGLRNGLLVTNPIPEQFALPVGKVEEMLGKAIKEAEEAKVSGKALTPFLLQKMFAMSEGKTIKTNKALLKNNAALGAQVAISLASK